MNAIIMELRASASSGYREGDNNSSSSSSSSSAADLEKIKELTQKLDDAVAEIESHKSKESGIYFYLLIFTS